MTKKPKKFPGVPKTEKPEKWPGLPGRLEVEEYGRGFRVTQYYNQLGIYARPGILIVSIVGPLRKTRAAAIRAHNRAVEKAREGK